MEPPLSHDLAKGLRILLLYLTLACLTRNFDRKPNGWLGRASCSLEKDQKWAGLTKSGHGFSKFRAHFTCDSIMEPPLLKSCIRHWVEYSYYVCIPDHLATVIMRTRILQSWLMLSSTYLLLWQSAKERARDVIIISVTNLGVKWNLWITDTAGPR